MSLVDAQRLQSLLESLNDGVLIETPDRRVQFTNQRFCEMFGITADPTNLAGSDWVTAATQVAQQFVHPEQFLSGVDRPLPDGRESGEPLQMLDGRVLERDYSRITDPDGSEPGHLWVFRDVTRHAVVTERALEGRYEAEVESQAKDRYMATMSHEIRTPLNGMIGMLDLLQGERMNPGASEMVAIIRQSADALLALLNDMLEFARTSSDQVVLDVSPADPLALARSVRELFRASAAQTDVAIVVTTKGQVPSLVQIDASRVRQVLLNLVGNAVKFTTSGQIVIGLAYEEIHDEIFGAQHTLVMSVEDSGEGIDPEIASRLFEPFTIGRERGGGTGLGLAICNRLVELMGGEIAWHERPGGGSIFTTKIPTSTAVVEGTGSDVIEVGRLEELAHELGEREIVTSIVEMFVDLLPGRVDAVVSARGDSERQREAAHALKSAARTIGAVAIANSAEAVERICMLAPGDSPFSPAVGVVDQMLEHVEPTTDALNHWISELRTAV